MARQKLVTHAPLQRRPGDPPPPLHGKLEKAPTKEQFKADAEKFMEGVVRASSMATIEGSSEEFQDMMRIQTALSDRRVTIGETLVYGEIAHRQGRDAAVAAVNRFRDKKAYAANLDEAKGSVNAVTFLDEDGFIQKLEGTIETPDAPDQKPKVSTKVVSLATDAEIDDEGNIILGDTGVMFKRSIVEKMMQTDQSQEAYTAWLKNKRAGKPHPLPPGDTMARASYPDIEVAKAALQDGRVLERPLEELTARVTPRPIDDRPINEVLREFEDPSDW